MAGKSLNEAAVDALAEGAGIAGARRKRRDLGDIAGSLAVRVALDTNRYVDLCKGVVETVTLLEEAEVILLPFVSDGVRVLFADDQTAHHYASIFRQLRKQGTPIPTNDMWLAALVLQHNLALHARDKHFDHLPQVVRV